MGSSDVFLGVAGYAPDHVETVDELRQLEGERLQGLVGATLDDHYAVWDREGAEWFTDGAVVLDFAVARLELAAFKLHLCFSWAQIDVGQPVDWYGTELQLEWRRDVLPELRRARGRRLDAIEIVTWQGSLNGLGLQFDGAYVELFNALDELGIAAARGDEPYLPLTG